MRRVRAHGCAGILWGALMLTVVAGLPAVPAAQEAGSAPKVKVLDQLETIREKAAQIKSVTATQVMTMDMMGQQMKMASKVFFRAPGFFRMELDMEGMPMAKSIVVSDGSTVWTHMPAANMTQKIDLKQVKAAAGPGAFDAGRMNLSQQSANFADPFSGFEEGSIKYLAVEPVEGVDCCLFEAELAAPGGMADSMGQMMPRKVNVWLGQDDGMIRKQVFFGVQGNKMMEMTFSDPTLNPPLDDGLFQYTPKPDEKVMDMTDMLVNMYKAMGQGTGSRGGSAAKPEGIAPKPEAGEAKTEVPDRGI